MEQTKKNKKMYAICLDGEPTYIFPDKELANEQMILLEKTAESFPAGMAAPKLGIKGVSVEYF